MSGGVRVAPDISTPSTRRSYKMLSSHAQSSQSSLPSIPSVPPVQAAEVPFSAKMLPKRVLVVDDVLSNRKMLMRILTSKGYVCEQAEDGQQAIDVYRASLASGNLFDAITMDYEMPVMNGPTATGKLRELGCTFPIIGVTGNMLPEDVKFFQSQGATAVVGKPLNMALFENILLENS